MRHVQPLLWVAQGAGETPGNPIRLSLFFSLALLCSAAVAPGGIIYVDGSATGADNGTSWANAYTDLNSALTAAVSGDEVRVAAGLYRPAPPGGNQSNRFDIKSGVALYGGFPAGGGSSKTRFSCTRPTILSGDLNGDDGSGNQLDNAYQVVYLRSAVLDGVTVTAGSGCGSLEICDRTCTIRNCIFRDNYGGAISSVDGDVTVINCAFLNNLPCQAGRSGGIEQDIGKLTVTNCTFVNNSDSGISSTANQLLVTNSIFWDNLPCQIDDIAGTAQVTYSCVQGGWSGTGNISVDPQLVDAAADDPHVLPVSQCVDVGTSSAPKLESHDLEGDPRPWASEVDIGADETAPRLYVSGTPSPRSSFLLRIIGTPLSTPNFLIRGGFVLDPPLSTPYGDWCLGPAIVFYPLKPLPPNGLETIKIDVPPSVPPTVVPIQAFLGNRLTNLCLIDIR